MSSSTAGDRLTVGTVFHNRVAIPVYVFLAVVMVGFGLFWGFVVQRYDPWITVLGTLAGTILVLAAVGQGLFIEVRITEDRVLLTSPFRRKQVRRRDIASIDLWERTPTEGEKGLLRQGASLTFRLSDGRSVGVVGFDVAVLRAIKRTLAEQ